MRQRDLTEIINKKRSRRYLGRALAMHWSAWGQYERDNAESTDTRLRNLSRRARAEGYGLKMSV